jgi:hypothetical protein
VLFADSTTSGLFTAVFSIASALLVIGFSLGFLVKQVVPWLIWRYENAPVTIVERRPNDFLAGNPPEVLPQAETEPTLSAFDSVS